MNPADGFTLNNMGYVAELQGDRETADEFYAKARRAQGASDKVTFSNQREMQGLKLGAVAGINDEKVETTMEASAEARRRMGGPIQLKRRNGAPVTEPEAVPQRPPGSEQAPEPQAAPAAEPQEPTPRAPSPYSPEPPKMPAPQMPEPSTQPAAPATQPPQSMAPASKQPSSTPPPSGQSVPQTSSPAVPQSSFPVATPAPPSPEGQQAQPIQPGAPVQPPQNAPQIQNTTPPSTVQPQQ